MPIDPAWLLADLEVTLHARISLLFVILIGYAALAGCGFAHGHSEPYRCISMGRGAPVWRLLLSGR
jgi:hypothetical protein